MRSKKAMYNIFTNLVLEFVIIIYGFIVPKIIISNFGSNVNGLISSITQFLGYITLIESGFGPVVKAALYKPISKKDNKEIIDILKVTERFFRNISSVFIIYIICLCFLYPLLINKEFDFIFTISLIIIISISTFAEYFFGMTYRLYLQADQKTYVISIIKIVTYILSVVAIIVLTKLNCSIQIIKLVSGLLFVLRPIIQNIYVKKKYNISLKNANKNYELKNKWQGLAQHIASVIHANTDITILTIFCSLSEISVYSVYYLVVKGIKQLIQSFNSGIDASFGDMIARNEKENLRKKFSIYEVIYFTIATILFICSIILIVPFVSVYTQGINDANYIRHTFGYLIVISEYIWAIRLPYSSITLSAGHFKEVKNGAWLEAIVNIIVSLILVQKYGIIGVAIGTIVAMIIRTVEFIYHANKCILDRNNFESVKKITLITFETCLLVFLFKFFPMLENISYINWIINAVIIFIIVTILVIIINYLFYKTEYKELKQIIRRVLNKRIKVFNKNNV